jgi:hypothetical protein
MKVDLPTPGTPEMPTRIDLPLYGSSASSTCCRARRWSLRVLSSSVMVFASARRSRASTPIHECGVCGPG